MKLWVGAYESKLLEARLHDYRKLWKLTQPTSRRYIDALSDKSATALAEGLTNWYYCDGGIILSEDARDRFFAARESLESPKQRQQINRWHTDVVDAFSALRTALCEDMNSRRGPSLRMGEQKDLALETQIESQAE